MKIIDIVQEDFLQYKLPSMFILFPYCTMKCEKDCGKQCCQNRDLLAFAYKPDVSTSEIVSWYVKNDITKAIVLGGLEPFDSFNDVKNLITEFRKITLDDIVIYSGYKEDEITKQVEELKEYPNIIIKFGRYVPNEKPHLDDLLGVYLSSNNQYAKKIS